MKVKAVAVKEDKVIAALKKLDAVKIVYDYEYVGPPDKRERVELDRIESVQFGLSAEEWCALCMREGQYYMGACCGQTSAIQDIYNSIFRDGGWASGQMIRELMECAARHDGFEVYGKAAPEELLGLIRKWHKLDPITKIGVICQAVADKLKTNRMDQPNTGKQEPEDFIIVLEHSLRMLSFQNVFRDEKQKESSQHHANQELLLARAVPAAKKFLAETVRVLSKPFEGVAIAKSGTDEIQQNRLGLCIYKTKEEAEEVIGLWKKSRDEARDDEKEALTKHIDSLVLRHISIDPEHGVVLWPGL